MPDAQDHVLAFLREIDSIYGYPDRSGIGDFVDLDSHNGIDEALRVEQGLLKTELYRRLGKESVFTYGARLQANTSAGLDVTTDHIEQFCADVERRLTEFVKRQIAEYWSETTEKSEERSSRELEIEQDEHERFGLERGDKDTFVGRAAELQAILDYVHGASGCGKTALLARASRELAPPNQPIMRFIGVTPRSSDVRSMLGSLCQELRLRNLIAGDLPLDVNVLATELRDHFLAATVEHPIVLFLDALDQLSDTDNGRSLSWLPTGQLPSDVKIVVSCLSDRATDDPAGRPFVEFGRRKLPVENLVNLNLLSDPEAQMLVFDRWLPGAKRKVSDVQRLQIESRLTSASCRQPIYLRLLFEEARLWRSYEIVPELGEGVSALLEQLFDHLSQPANHGRLLVERAMVYLATSRWGLAETEILEILFADPEYKAAVVDGNAALGHEMPTAATRIPIAIWSRLRFDLSPYLTERSAPGSNVLAFYHRQVSEYVLDRFAKEAAKEWNPHGRLMAYFHRAADPEEMKKWAGDRPRPFLELMFHLCGAGLIDELCDTLCDLLFVEARCHIGQVFELIADYALAKDVLPVAQEKLKEERAHQEVLKHYASDLTAYSKAWSDRRDRDAEVAVPEPMRPLPPPTCRMWSEDEIETEYQRLLLNPTQLDRFDAFAGFVTGQCYPLLGFGRRPGFVRQHTFNVGPGGAVHDAAVPLLVELAQPQILRRWPVKHDLI